MKTYRIANTEWMLKCSLPVSVFVCQCQKNLCLVVAIRLGHEFAQKQIPFHSIQAIFSDCLGEMVRCLHSTDTKKKIIRHAAFVRASLAWSRSWSRWRRRRNWRRGIGPTNNHSVDAGSKETKECTKVSWTRRSGHCQRSYFCCRLIDPLEWRFTQAVHYGLGVTAIADQMNTISSLRYL